MKSVRLFLGLPLLLSATFSCAAPSTTAVTPAQAVFNEWLSAFNSADRRSILAFEQNRLGDSDIDFVLDNRQDTGGFDLVRLELNEPLKLTAILRERDYPSLQTLTLELADPQTPLLKDFRLQAQELTTEQSIAALDALAGKLASRDEFSGVILVRQRGKTLLRKAWGLADRENKKNITPDTPFFMASQGKMFTAVAILQLIEAGKLALDAPLARYLPDLPNQDLAKKVTLRHLLTHRGGTGDIDILGADPRHTRDWVKTIDDVLALHGKRELAFEPGTKEDYSNFGFILLGAVIEKVSGQSYYDYLAQHIFGPAGMHSTSFPDKVHLAGIAVGYTLVDGQLVANTAFLPWRGLSAGGGVSTADDLLRFVDALQAGKLISKSMLAEATRQQTPWYGFGFISSGPADKPHWGHGGGAEGMSLVLAVYPGTDIVAICMSNRDPPIADRLMINYHFRMPNTPAVKTGSTTTPQ